MARYVPDAGHIVWLNFAPQAGHEQARRRPIPVLSPAAYNNKTSLMICCPMTTQIKNYPFEVVIAGATPSVVLADQVKSGIGAFAKRRGRLRYPQTSWRRFAPRFWPSSVSKTGQLRSGLPVFSVCAIRSWVLRSPHRLTNASRSRSSR
jgi:mRNA interferase MazF